MNTEPQNNATTSASRSQLRFLSPDHRPSEVRRQPNTKLMQVLRASILFLAALILLLGTTYLLLPLLRVQKVEVTGQSIYSAEEILKASGIVEGEDETFAVLSNGADIRRRIKNECPYVKSVTIVVMPFTVKLEITEYSDVRVSAAGKKQISYLSDYTVLEVIEAGESFIYPFPSVKLPEDVKLSVTLGKPIVFDRDVTYINEFYHLLQERELLPYVTAMNCESRTSLSCVLGGRFLVKFGTLNDIDDKLELLTVTMQKKEAAGVTLNEIYAIVDVSDTDKAYWQEVSDASQFD